MNTRTLTKVGSRLNHASLGASVLLLLMLSALTLNSVGCGGNRDVGPASFERRSNVVGLIGWAADEQSLLIRLVRLRGSGDALEATCDSTGIWMVRVDDQRMSRFGSADWCKRAPLMTAAAFDGRRDLLAYADVASLDGLKIHSAGKDINIALNGCGGLVHGLALAAASDQFAVVAACNGAQRLLVGRLPESPSEGEHVNPVFVASGVLGRPAWLGRSDRIAVSLADRNRGESIRVVDAAGESLAVVRGGLSPAGNSESPDLLFLRDPEPQATPRRIEVWIREGAVGPERQLASVKFCGATPPAGRVDVDLLWSSSGSRIAVRAGTCIWLVRDVSGTRQVTELRSR